MTSTSEGAESGAVAETTYVNEFGAEADAPVMRLPEAAKRVVAERDAARAEVERAFRAGCLAPVGALVASDEVIDRAWTRYRQQRAAKGGDHGAS